MENALATLLPIRRITAATIAGRITRPIIKFLPYPSFLQIYMYTTPMTNPNITATHIPNIDEPMLMALSVAEVVNIDSNIIPVPFFPLLFCLYFQLTYIFYTLFRTLKMMQDKYLILI